MAMIGDTRTVAGTAAFRHEALLYAGPDGFLDGALPFVRAALQAEEPILVMVGPAKIDLLCEALGGDVHDIAFADMQKVGANPARIIPAWRDFVDERGAEDRAVHGIGEPIWSGGSPAELVEGQRHESLLNLAFADGPAMRLLCPYDTDSLDPAVIAEVHRSHPTIVEDGAEHPSDGYHGIEVAAAPFAHPLTEVPVDAAALTYSRGTLDHVRQFVAEWAERAGVNFTRRADLVLAVNEVATNSVLHGGGEGDLLVWIERDAVVCELRDSGRFDHPLAGRVRPEPGRVGGHGLWLANQVCDLVQVRSFPTGTVVRLHLRRS